MVKLYHFTSVSLGEAILSSSLSEGHLVGSDGGMRQKVVWLTADCNPGGNGLLTGQEKLDSKAVSFMEKVQGGPLRNNITQDKTKLRITVEVEPSAYLIKFRDYCKQYEKKGFAKIMGLSTLYDLQKLSDKELLRLARTTTTKESTWWLSFHPISPDSFIAVDCHLGKNKFETYTREKQGREELLSVGLIVPSATALAELAAIAPSQRPIPNTQAIVFCEHQDSAPSVEIRLDEGRTFFCINTQIALGNVNCKPDILGPLQEWIRRNRSELLHCWEIAVERYNAYYPNARYTGQKNTAKA